MSLESLYVVTVTEKSHFGDNLKNHHESFHQENPPLTDCLYRVSCWSLVLFYQHGSRSQSNGGPNPQYWDYSLRVEEGEKPLLRKSLIIVRIDVWQKFIGPGRPWAWHIKKIFSFFEWLTVPLESATSVLAKRIFRRLWQNFPQWRSWWVIGGMGVFSCQKWSHYSLKMWQTLRLVCTCSKVVKKKSAHSQRSIEFRWTGLQSKCYPCPHPLSTIDALVYEIRFLSVIQCWLSAAAPTRKPKQKRKKNNHKRNITAW